MNACKCEWLRVIETRINLKHCVSLAFEEEQRRQSGKMSSGKQATKSDSSRTISSVMRRDRAVKWCLKVLGNDDFILFSTLNTSSDVVRVYAKCRQNVNFIKRKVRGRWGKMLYENEKLFFHLSAGSDDDDKRHRSWLKCKLSCLTI